MRDCFQDRSGDAEGQVAIPFIEQIRRGFIGIRIASRCGHAAERFELKRPEGFNLQADVCQGIDKFFQGMAAGRGLA